MNQYIHNVPGRLRVRIPRIKRNPFLAEEVQALMRPVPGVLDTVVNLVTGSLTVFYDQKTAGPREILSLLRERGHFDPAKAVTNDQYIHTAASSAGRVVVKAVFGSVVEKTFESSALSLLAAFI